MASHQPNPAALETAGGADETAERELSFPARAGTGARLAIGAAAPVSVVAIAYALLAGDAATRAALGYSVLTAAPAIALGALLAATLAAPPGRRAAWALFSAAAAAALTGQVLATLEYLGLASGSAFPTPVFLLFTAFHPLFISGVLATMRGCFRTGLNRDTVLDATVLGAVTTVLLLRFAFEPVWSTSQLTGWRFALGLLPSALVLGSFCAAAVLLLWRGVPAPDRVLAALAGTGLAFACGHLVLRTWAGSAGMAVGGPLDLVWLAGWTSFAIAGFAGASRGNWIVAASAPSRLAEMLRRLVLPGAAVFLGAAALHTTLRPASLATAVAVGLLGVVIAARTTLALRAAERRAEERQEMAQTRALVELSRELAAVRHLERTLELVAEGARRLLEAKSAVIELVSEDGHALELRAAAGLHGSMVGLRFPIAGSFTGWVVRHGRPRATADATRDPTIQPQSLPYLGPTAVAAAPLRYRDRTVGALGVIRDEPFDLYALRLLQLLADRAGISIENARLFEQVEALSLTDPLTNLANRRQFERDLAREFAAARRGRKLVAVLFDLDDLKLYNDRYGHLAGDEALRLFGNILAGHTRTMNLAARYGGDEFVTLLADTELEGAESFAARVCDRFREESERLGRGPLSMTAGLAEFSPAMGEPHDLIAAADASLYRNKSERARA